MKKSIEDYELLGKKTIIRVDFNVPLKDNKILDDTRIIASLKTIEYAINKGAKVILMSHLGRIKNESDKSKNSLKIVSHRLQELLNKPVKFIDCLYGKKLEDEINKMKNGDVLLLENTRFLDVKDNLETNCDKELSKYWASLADIFVNDAFATSHRANASNVGIATYLPNCVGFLIQDELKKFELLKKPIHPYTLILGGAKISDKIGVIENLIEKCDYILIGGAMAYTFLCSMGYNVGKSIVDNDKLDFCFEILSKYRQKIILPQDSVTSKKIGKNPILKDSESFESDDIGLDIGDKTIYLFKSMLKGSNTIVWNGPLGYSEIEMYSKGTKEILNFLSNSDKKIIIGGGDTASCAINFGYKNSFTHISTGGGASLELLEGKNLPGIKIINEK